MKQSLLFTLLSAVIIAFGGLGAHAADLTFETVTLPYSEAFTSNQGKFQIQDVSLPSELSWVWRVNSSRGYISASAYKSNTNYAAESWLISPYIDLTGAGKPQLAFKQAFNYFNSSTIANEATLLVKEKDATDWTPLTLTYPNSMSWTFYDASFDLSAYAGKTIQIAFKYVSTASKAGTWEIKNLSVSDGAPVVTYTDKTIAELNQDTKNNLTNVNLKFNNAQVVYVDPTQGAFVREGDYAIQLYKTALSFTAGQVVNGSAKFDYSPYYGIPETKDISGVTDASQLTLTAGTAQPVAVTLAQLVALSHRCDLVQVNGVKLVSADGKTYMTLGTDSVQLFDKFGTNLIPATIDESKTYDVTGIFGSIYNDAPEVFPTAIAEVQAQKQPANISFSAATATATMGKAFIQPVLSNPNNLTVAYASSNAAVATVDAATGKVTLAGEGTATITATSQATDQFEAGEAKYVLTVNAAPVTPVVTLPYSESFAQTPGKFTINTVTNPNNIADANIWKVNTSLGCIVASGYQNRKRVVLDSYLVSPLIDMSGMGTATLTFAHTGKFFSQMDQEVFVKVREGETGEWETLTIPTWFTGQDWDFVNVTMDLTAYAGKTIQLGFEYTSNETTAPSWEIKDLKVVGTIAKQPANLSFSTDRAIAILGEEFTEPVLSNPNQLPVTYTSSDPAVATVDAATGKVTLVGDGPTFITATSQATDQFEAGEAHYQLQVMSPLPPSFQGIKFVKVKEVTDGAKYLMAATYNGTTRMAKAIDSPVATKKYTLSSEVVIPNNDTITVSDYADALTLVATGDGYTIMQNDGNYLYWYHKGAESETKDTYQVRLSAETSGTASPDDFIWTVKPQADGTMEIANVMSIMGTGSDARRTRYFQFDSRHSDFCLYNAASSQRVMPSLYMEVRPMTAVADVATDKAVASVTYVDLQGRVSAQPFQGLNIVVTTYTDGTRQAAKRIIK